MNDDPLGYVETPPALADELAGHVMVTHPEAGDRILYPGAGQGNIAAAVHRRCSVRGLPCPDAVFVERDSAHLDTLGDRFVGADASHNHGVPPTSEDSAWHHKAYRGTISKARVDADAAIRHTDFLADPPSGTFEYIVANPPYTAYPNIETERREAYAERFETASGQFPLYALFVEQMLDLLAPNGVLAVLLPTNWLTIQAVRPLRDRLRHEQPSTPILIPDPAFPDHSVQTTAMVVGRTDSRWTGEPRAPSNTRIYLTHMHGPAIDPFLERVGVADADLDDAAEEYMDRTRFLQRLVGNRGRRERQELDDVESTDTGTQQALARWSA